MAANAEGSVKCGLSGDVEVVPEIRGARNFNSAASGESSERGDVCVAEVSAKGRASVEDGGPVEQTGAVESELFRHGDFGEFPILRNERQ